ncbi:MAG: hypothetical protein AAB546_01300 [Patescibacteria group bacterium]
MGERRKDCDDFVPIRDKEGNRRVRFHSIETDDDSDCVTYIHLLDFSRPDIGVVERIVFEVGDCDRRHYEVLEAAEDEEIILDQEMVCVTGGGKFYRNGQHTISNGFGSITDEELWDAINNRLPKYVR